METYLNSVFDMRRAVVRYSKDFGCVVIDESVFIGKADVETLRNFLTTALENWPERGALDGMAKA